MSKVPDSELLALTAKQLDGDISLEWDRISKVLDANPGRPRSKLFNEFTHVFNLMTRRHVLELQRTYPTLKVMYQVRIDGLRDADGHWLDAPRRLGRIPDGALMGDLMRFVEVKTIGEVLRSVPKGTRQVFSEYLASTKLGGQIANEKAILKWAGRRGVAFQFTAQDPVTLISYKFEVAVKDVGVSLVQTYKNMGDGIEASTLFKPRKAPAGGAERGNTLSEPEHGEIKGKELIKPAKETINRRGLAPENTRGKNNEPATENRATGSRGGTTSKPSKPVASSRRSSLPAPENRRSAYPVYPGGLLGRMHETTNAIGGAARILYDKQVENQTKLAWRHAEDSVSAPAMAKAIFKAREQGFWVLIYVVFAETKAPDANGNRMVRFMYSDFKVASPLSGIDDEDTMLERLRRSQFLSEYSERSYPGKTQSLASGWQLRSQEYTMLKGFSNRDLGVDPRFHQNDTRRGTIGRCTR
jgi:hypothetical protein